ncbi:MAG TPA: glutaredoxin 3 [Sedimenticola thiotaurini]|uniref:Glutaredoxin n=1 Tax=Sedimenticola thiotaurini TaxID=1543721 RepID=A0A831W6S4_9GAMM|nr:glutaredoxin 3 [Sedimenticola thiotaurini]
MPEVVIYTTNICPYCVRAKALLKRKGVSYEERNIEGSRELMKEMLQRSRRRTVPQIFIDDFHVGGYDDMAELDMLGRLDPLLGLEPHLEPDVTQEEPDIT